MLPLTVFMCAFGAIYVLFAFVAPPRPVTHFFRVPAVFVFLPERMQGPVGRTVAGLLCIGVGVFLQVRFG